MYTRVVAREDEGRPEIEPAEILSSDEHSAKREVNVKPRTPVGVMTGTILGGTIRESSHRSAFLGDILLKNGDVTAEAFAKALAIQEERGGQLGRILVSMGACTEAAIARALIEQLRQRRLEGNKEKDLSAAARENPAVAGLKVLCRPRLTVFTLLVFEAFALFLSAGAGFLAERIHKGAVHPGEMWVIGATIIVSLLLFAFLDLYSPLAKTTPDELRDIVTGTSIVHLVLFALSASGNLASSHWQFPERLAWWAATLFVVPIVRALVRSRFSRLAWWGIPVIVLGAAKTGRLVVRTLKAQPRSGLKPVALLDDDASKHGTLRASYTNETVDLDLRSINVSATNFLSESTRAALADELLGPEIDSGPPSGEMPTDSSRPSSWFPRGKFAEVEGVPLVGDLALAPILAKRLKIPYAIVAMPGVDSPRLLEIVERVGGKFSHLLVIPDLFGFATLGVPARTVGGVLGVEVRQQLLLPWPRATKRVIDVVLTSLGGICILPFLLLIALLIKLDSKGPVFYKQKRLGRDGEHFMAFKFRTMHGDGEARLRAVLESDPALRAEYEIYHKLKKDPRVTRFGRILRKYSLDEFPQLLSVLFGDMSLVGPRPYIERELPEMNGQEKLILRATPGMTGLWQVSDRNATSFIGRVHIDVHYVRNWSPWLDMYILAKTVGVVVRGSGV